MAFNTLPWSRAEVVEVDCEIPGGQKSTNGKTLVHVDVPSMGYAPVHKADAVISFM